MAAMDQLAKLTIAIARSGMPCPVGENTRVISSGLRKMSKGHGADSVNTAVLHRSDAVGETVDPGIMCHDHDRPVGSEHRCHWSAVCRREAAWSWLKQTI